MDRTASTSGTSEDAEETSTSGSETSDEEQQDVPFQDRVRQRQTGHTSRTQIFERLKGGSALPKSVSKDSSAIGRAEVKSRFKRENKNRPAEQSYKKPVSRFRDVVGGHKRHAVDPRFDDLAGGKFRDETFKKRYSFLFDEQLPQEKTQLKRRLKSTRSGARKQELQAELTRIEQQIRAEQDQRRQRSAEQASKAKEKEAVKAGKRPFFLKKSEKKKQELIRKYHDLKASGRLEKAMAKKRRKNAAKDHRYVPNTR